MSMTSCLSDACSFCEVGDWFSGIVVDSGVFSKFVGLFSSIGSTNLLSDAEMLRFCAAYGLCGIVIFSVKILVSVSNEFISCTGVACDGLQG